MMQTTKATATTISITAGTRIPRHGGDLIIVLRRAGVAIVTPMLPAPPSTSNVRWHEQRKRGEEHDGAPG
jgi:hypothetical protein